MNKIILFYKYIQIPDPEVIKLLQQELCIKLNLKGRILVAHEGINGTLGGKTRDLDHYIDFMNNHELFGAIDFKESPGSSEDFPRLQIRVKKEICNLGLDPEVINAQDGGVHLNPQEVHALLLNRQNDLIILDGRNNYESRIGAFEGAIKPDISNFRDFPEYIDNNQELFKDKEVLMYCTGGIRCERASSYLKSKNIAKKIYQLKGGIHRYVEQFPDGFFKGKNYIFDARQALPITPDILTECDRCKTPWDTYSSCLNALCNKQIVMCPACIKELENSCSIACRELLKSGAVKHRPTPYRGSLCSLS